MSPEYFTLKMEVVCSSESCVLTGTTRRHHVPKGSILLSVRISDIAVDICSYDPLSV
jgi:hypothetical protein